MIEDIRYLSPKELGGEAEFLISKIEKRSNIAGLSLGAKVHLLSFLDKPVVLVVEDRLDVVKYFNSFSMILGEEVAMLCENEDLFIFRKGYQSENIAKKMKVLASLIEGKIKILIVTAKALLDYYPNIEKLKQDSFTIENDKDYDIYELSEKLVKLGYRRESVLSSKGEFTIKGDVISVFAVDYEMPIRISFFGDTVEYIKIFDIDNLLSIGTMEEIKFFPITEFNIDFDEYSQIRENIEGRFPQFSSKAKGRMTEILDEIAIAIKGGADSKAVLWMLPFKLNTMSNFFDYISEQFAFVIDNPINVYNILDLLFTEQLSRLTTGKQNGELLSEHLNILFSYKKVLEILKTKNVSLFSQSKESSEIFNVYNFYQASINPGNPYYLRIQKLFEDIEYFLGKKTSIYICCGDKSTAEGLSSNLMREGIMVYNQDEIPNHRYGVFVTEWNIKDGFYYNGAKALVIGTAEIVQKTEYKRKLEKKRGSFIMPECGDFVVHEDFGIGKCEGIRKEKTGNAEKDYVVIKYAGDNRLFVPIDQMNRIEKYCGGEESPKLASMGGNSFAKVKAQVHDSIKAMAFNLAELYGKRHRAIGFRYGNDTDYQLKFEKKFPFQETEDQLTAIKEIKQDMEKGIIMDRLLCGDVGFGKTEVALRAIFKTVVEGKQAVMLAPTTILAHQHFQLVEARFKEFGLKAECLSRFRTPVEIKASLQRIAEGRANIIVGTHRLLSKDVQFSDLGLLVLDEEQRFGVVHKEKIKLLKNNINVLTMSATPIPRTLNMALTGIRDISLLETPPVNRLPVQTYVTKLSDGLLKETINRELDRDGQVFVLYNRVDGIDGFAERIKELVPSAKIAVAHGQMDKKLLEDVVEEFYKKNINVLVCTTIIENGIDLPDANTLIVCKADRLGLSALYQLRGRVGRSGRLAYAYLTTDYDEVSELSRKRLDAIMNYTALGSGFKIAMRDLELRGAGEILGREQHGHMAKIGYEMYCRFLNDAVDEANGKVVVKKSKVDIYIDIDSAVPENFITEPNEKIRLYKEIASISCYGDVENILESMKANYGDIPQSVVNLVEVGWIKFLAENINVKKIIINNQQVTLTFYNNEDIKQQKILNALIELKNWKIGSGQVPTVENYSKNCIIYEKFRKVIDFLLKSNGI